MCPPGAMGALGPPHVVAPHGQGSPSQAPWPGGVIPWLSISPPGHCAPRVQLLSRSLGAPWALPHVSPPAPSFWLSPDPNTGLNALCVPPHLGAGGLGLCWEPVQSHRFGHNTSPARSELLWHVGGRVLANPPRPNPGKGCGGEKHTSGWATWVRMRRCLCRTPGTSPASTRAAEATAGMHVLCQHPHRCVSWLRAGKNPSPLAHIQLQCRGAPSSPHAFPAALIGSDAAGGAGVIWRP